MKIDLVYALKEQQKLYFLDLLEGVTIKEAIEESGLLNDFPEVDLQQQKIGIYGEVFPLNHKLQDKDRIEIYRALTIDPKDARRIRAEEKRKKQNLNAFGA